MQSYGSQCRLAYSLIGKFAKHPFNIRPPVNEQRSTWKMMETNLAFITFDHLLILGLWWISIFRSQRIILSSMRCWRSIDIRRPTIHRY